MTSQSYGFQCGSNYPSPSQGCNSSSYSHAVAACKTIVYNYQCHQSYTSSCYQQTHHCGGTTTPTTVTVLTLAMQDAAKIGAGVQGDIGCTLDAHGQPTAPDLSSLPPADNTDFLVSNLGVTDDGMGNITTAPVNNTTAVLGDGMGDSLTATSGDLNVLAVGNGDGDTVGIGDINDPTVLSNGNILVAGNGAGDFVYVGSGNNNQLFAGNGDGDFLIVNNGNSNALIVGDGAFDTILVSSGNNNDLHAGNGTGDQLLFGTGDNNCLTVGNGDGDIISFGTGTSNELTAGNGAGDIVSMDTGDNNLLTAGTGAHDQLIVGTGDHNTLLIGNGLAETLTVGTGDYNLLHAGDGAGDTLVVSSGNFNALIAGNGAGDSVTVEAGNNNILAVGDGAGDLLQLFSGSNNLLLDGNGANDTILVGGVVGTVGTGVNSGNNIVIGNGDGDQAWGSLGDGNNYLTGKGNDLVHTGGGADLVYVHNHTEQSTAAMADPWHLTTQDSLAQNLFADGGNDTFVLQGTQLNSCQTYSHQQYGCNYSTAVTWQSELKQVGGDAPGLGTTVMTGGGGVEKYWFSDLWGNAVITDFNSVHGDRVMIGGVWDGALSGLNGVHTQYIHSAYDTSFTGNVDLLITFGTGVNNISQSITLIDFKPQDTTNAFNNATFNNVAAAESTLAHIFDFSHADNLAVTTQVASLAAQHLILQ